MSILRLTLIFLLGALLATQAFAHGLSKVGDKEVLFKQHGDLLIKAEMTPNSVNYNKDNSLYISIVDQQAGRFYQGEVNATFSSPDDGQVHIMSIENGIYKSKLQLAEGGLYQLNFDFKNTNGLTPAEIEFRIKDNRLFARNALAIAFSGLFILALFISGTMYLRNRNQTKVKIGGRHTCDI